MSSNSKGGGAPSSKSYNYFGSIAASLSIGALDEVFGIEVEDDLVWSGSLLRSSSPNPVSITVEGRGLIRLYWGTEDQLTSDPLLVSTGNGLLHDHPAYTGVAYIVLVNFLFGRERTSVPNIKVRARRKPVQTLISGSATNLVDGQANPFCVLAELFTNPRFGRSKPTSLFAASKWQAAANAAEARASECYVSPFLMRQEKGLQLGRSLLALCDGFCRMEFGTGLCEAGLMPKPETVDPNALTLLGTSALESKPSWEPDTWEDVTTRTVVRFTDRSHNFKQRPAKYDDPRARLVGDIRAEEISAPFIVRYSQAEQYAREQGRRLALPGLRGEISARAPRAESIQPGQRIRLDIDAEPGGVSLEQVFRVTNVSRSPLGPTKISVESERTLAPVFVAAPADPSPPETVDVPDIAYVRLFEMPPPLADGNDFAVGMLASRPDSLVTECAVMYDTVDDSDATFPPLGSHRNYALRAKLDAAYTSGASGVVSVELLDAINREIVAENPGDVGARNDTLLMLVFGALDTSGGGYRRPFEVFSVAELVSAGTNLLSVTALRARGGTPALNHADNAEAWFIRRDALPWYRHKDFRSRANAQQPCLFKLQPSTFQATRALEDCTVREFFFDTTRAYAPVITVTSPLNDSGKSYVSVGVGNNREIFGTITDADANLVKIVIARSINGAVEEVLFTRDFAESGSMPFSLVVNFPTGGTTEVTIRAQDVTSRVIEKRIQFLVGTLDSGKLEPPSLFQTTWDMIEMIALFSTPSPSGGTSPGVYYYRAHASDSIIPDPGDFSSGDTVIVVDQFNEYKVFLQTRDANGIAPSSDIISMSFYRP